jgi:hypothetical protein
MDKWKALILMQRVNELARVPYIVDGKRQPCAAHTALEMAVMEIRNGDLFEAERWVGEAEWVTLKRYSDPDPFRRGVWLDYRGTYDLK